MNDMCNYRYEANVIIYCDDAKFYFLDWISG